MAIIIYTETAEGRLKNTVRELASYAHILAEQLNTKVVAIAINSEEVEELSKFGVNKTLKISSDKLSCMNAQAYAESITQAALQEEAEMVLFSSSIDSIYIAPLVAVKLNAGYTSNVVSLPQSLVPFQVKRNVFTSKAFSITEITTKTKVLGIIKNSIGEKPKAVEMITENFAPKLEEKHFGTRSKSVTKNSGKIAIADADIVVSGGRGLKGPENWGIIEDLAEAFGGAIACTKPVADLGWRPHSEHVGQTGIAVSANMYVAVGISGAIQHVAGINSSRIKLVINNDPEAPFFKVADYGILGDAFEVLPKLVEKIKAFKKEN